MRGTALARPRSRCMSTLQTHPLVREGDQHQEPTNCQYRKKLPVMSYGWVTDTKICCPIGPWSSKIPDNVKMVILPKRKCHNVNVTLQLVPCTDSNKGLLQYQSFKVAHRNPSFIVVATLGLENSKGMFR
jgi:hypothetical protein